MISNLKYHFRVRHMIKEIKYERGNMIHNRSHHKRARGTRATDRTRIVNDAILEWLDEADKFLKEEKNLEMKIKAETEMQRKYEMYREMLEEIKKLNARCERAVIPRRDVGLDFFLTWETVCFEFESTKKAWHQLWEALNDDNDGSNIIGLYGEQGSGKTTLALAVVRNANYYDDFKKAVFISVSQNTDPWRIQEQIANSLHLLIREISDAGRSAYLYHRLLEGRYIVVLDNVGAELDLKGIGIPCNSNKCKVLLTTRHQQECTLMECQREIPLNPISEKEALTMLKKLSGIADESPSDLLNVAQEVAFECKGLPGTVKDVGSSLKNKPIEEWMASLNNLRHPESSYQVFLSFRGEDTRYTFTGSLYYALCREGFKTFMDKDGLQGGNQISESLIKAIEDSRLSIIVFSENYAYSSWCLDELVTILECRKTKNQQILPIFYKVDPSDIRHLKNNYGKAMAALENRFANDSEKVQRWRSALSEVANLSGKHYSTGYEYEFIQMIVEEANNIKSRLDKD